MSWNVMVVLFCQGTNILGCQATVEDNKMSKFSG